MAQETFQFVVIDKLGREVIKKTGPRKCVESSLQNFIGTLQDGDVIKFEEVLGGSEKSVDQQPTGNGK